MTVVFHSFVR